MSKTNSCDESIFKGTRNEYQNIQLSVCEGSLPDKLYGVIYFQPQCGTIVSGLVENYGILNLNIGYAFNDQLSLTVSTQNALNNKYRIMPNMPQIGRMILAKFSYSL